ncbi:HAD-IC family P-type ATPase [Arthrobacter sp. TMS1-12-1]
MPADHTGWAPVARPDGAGRAAEGGAAEGGAAEGGAPGLSAAEVLDRTSRGLVNTTPDSTGRSFLSILQANVLTLFNAVVGACFLALVLLGSWQDALFGFFVVANTLIGVVQEFAAKRALVRLAVLSTPRALVRRDGVDTECVVADVVLDDLLVLRPGEQVPADAEIIESHALEVDESLLTGEAVPVAVNVGRGLMSGSTIVAGAGLARVTGVGADSYAARITAEARQFALVDSELRRSIGRVIHWISLGLVPLSVIVVNSQMQAAGGWSAALANGAWRDATITAVAGINAMVPAGLVFMTSVALAVGAARLARRRVLIRELAAVEGLARVDVLCVDKTGTLTEGSFALDRLEPVDGAPPGWQQALAWFATDPAANATALAIGAGVPGARAGRASPDATVAFSSRHRWSGACFSTGSLRGSWILGGADVVLGAAAPGDATVARAAAIAASGTRTLVLAHSPRPLPSTGTIPALPDGLRPVALAVLRERVRPDAAETIRYFGEQGVRVVVISGDDPGTVLAVAREVQLPGELQGVDARGLPDEPEALAEVLRTESVFGRVAPDQKKAMVLALQSLGHTVAMTGDGINDALALKHADLGIAMGSGAPAARAVANLVLLDGGFAQLPGIVAEGRQVIANVERLAKLFLSKTVYAVLLALVFGVLLWPFPFLPRQLSVVDGLTIGLPALVLGLLPNTRRYSPGFLRRVTRWCVPSGVVVALAVLGVVTYARTWTRAPVEEIQTLAVITLTLSALWVLVVLARPFTRTTAGVVVGAYAGLPLILALPPARAFLGLALPPVELVLVAVGAAVVASVVLELVHRRIRT